MQFLNNANTTTRLDSGTQCGSPSMHCCPSGFGMIGVNLGLNKFFCAFATDPSNEVCTTDNPPGTQRQGMHACPKGSYMRGLHEADNRLMCCHDQTYNGFSTENIDPYPSDGATATQSYGMHTCPTFMRTGSSNQSITFMSGIHVGNNQQLCVSR